MASSTKDVEAPPTLDAPLLGSAAPRSRLRVAAVSLSVMAFLLVAIAAAVLYYNPGGVASNLMRLRENDYPWTNDMLRWQRTGFHFQPEKNFQAGN